jgi:predicted pyridoxine 5'-phosphate oxidase superfamily flavin-nucleotide-binding protein
MAEMSPEFMNMINGDCYCYVATASKDGMPNMAIIGSVKAVSPDTIIMAAGFMNKAFKNLQENPKASVIFYSGLPAQKTKASAAELAKATGGQVKGSVSLLTSGDVHEKMKAAMTERFGPEIGQMVKATVMLKVEEIYTVGLGPEAGKRIA